VRTGVSRVESTSVLQVRQVVGMHHLGCRPIGPCRQDLQGRKTLFLMRRAPLARRKSRSTTLIGWTAPDCSFKPGLVSPDTRGMRKLRQMAPLLLSVSLILGTGALGIALSNNANDKAEAVLRADRDNLESTLAGLGKQYLLFSLKEGLDYASTGAWSLRPGDPADAARLHSFVDHAVLLDYGAALVGLGGQPLNAYSSGPDLPSPTDPGYAPMKRALLAGKPDVSALMRVGTIPVVAMAVPIAVGGQTKALFVGFVRLDRSALETYVESLHYGKTGKAYVTDATGTVVASTDPAAIGTRLDQAQALAAVGRGRAGVYDDARSATTVAYAPFGIGGWAGLTLQNSTEFFGPIRSGHLSIELAIVAMLAVASGIILVFGYKREAARRRFHERLAHQAYHDGLTGLANRSLFHDRLGQALARATRQASSVAVLYLDLDGFKLANDREGHDAGDALLVEVAQRLRGVVRAEDTVARMGGDEFAIVMEDLDDIEVVTGIATRIVDEAARPFVLNGRELIIGASVGITYSRQGHGDVESLLRDADLAMYRAKDAGKNRYVISSQLLEPSLRGSASPREPVRS
jgi:diguanylate cyclase (GGDEF)-like protein